MATVELQNKDPASELEFLDDSGPYEEIPEDYLEKRPPIGRLPSYISLESSKSEDVISFTVDKERVLNVGDDVVEGIPQNVLMDENATDEDDGGVGAELFDERLIW